MEIFVPLPANCVVARDVRVDLRSNFLSIEVDGEPRINGELHSPVKAEASTWIVVDGVLEMSLLKRNRRGNYDDGCSNADTFWYSVCVSDKSGVGDGASTFAAPGGWRFIAPRTRTTTRIGRRIRRMRGPRGGTRTGVAWPPGAERLRVANAASLGCLFGFF